ncbi:hypothetical protein NDU88_003291 [Pleurodeles waltl]|uniref:Uncharacterized protein n=1 Tax=Pleurodeles waltl TaxID=8319 RepID=A0AAV7M2Z9_PLEWA|nr:hypothetical protein NDU88_003291 [Pleurodeles waltl]
MEGEYMVAALSLLKKAGHMDLVKQEALAALRRARKAAQGVAAAVLACSPPRSTIRAEQGARQVQPVLVGRALDGAQMVRRKAQKRPPSLTAGDKCTCIKMVSVAVEATEDVGTGAAHLVKGVYVVDAGVDTEGATLLEPVRGESGAQVVADGGSAGAEGEKQRSDTQQEDKAEQPVSKRARMFIAKRRARWRPRNAAAKRLLRPRKPPSVAAALPRVGASFGSRA